MIKLLIKLPIQPDKDVDRRTWGTRLAKLFQELYKNEVRVYLMDEVGGEGSLPCNPNAPDVPTEKEVMNA